MREKAMSRYSRRDHETSHMFTPEIDDEPQERGPDRRCTPELLLEFMAKLGKYPTLAELKKEFGGILGPMVDGWELQRTGRWPAFVRKR
jgi:hypothetical protein